MKLEFQDISHDYGANAALSSIDLVAPSGAITCLLGSSGCGKTTLLNLAAGLLKVQSGQITLDDQLLANAAHSPPPEKRPIGLVFQELALFAHMTIAQNILFGVAKDERTPALASQWLERIGLAGMEARYPHSLSGGQAQRVALARAMAPKPKVLLLDEPFASIDVHLRRQLRRDCRALLRAQKTTAIMVTHDPEEALEIADTVAIMEGGAIVQAGTPQDIHTRPHTLAIAALFDEVERIEARMAGDTIETPFGSWPRSALAQGAQLTGSITLAARPDSFTLEPDPSGLKLIDRHETGLYQRLVLANEDGQKVAILRRATQGEVPSGSMALHPRPASLLGFAK